MERWATERLFKKRECITKDWVGGSLEIPWPLGPYKLQLECKKMRWPYCQGLSIAPEAPGKTLECHWKYWKVLTSKFHLKHIILYRVFRRVLGCQKRKQKCWRGKERRTLVFRIYRERYLFFHSHLYPMWVTLT